MNPIDFLLNSNTERLSKRWSLLNGGESQLLPCRVPFENSTRDLSPAIQGYETRQLKDAKRYVELTRMSCDLQDADHWRLRLIEAALCVELGDGNEAWHQLQLALSWRNRREQDLRLMDALPPISIHDWLMMATIALAVNKVDTAERYASEAVARVQKGATSCSATVLRDLRADTMTVFATVRLAQQRFAEAETLLQLAYEAHSLVGDLEQMAVDQILLSDVEHIGGNRQDAIYLLFDAQSILDEQCDVTRHPRVSPLKQVIHQRLVDGQRPRKRSVSATLSSN